MYYIKPVAGATSYRWKCLLAGVLINGMPLIHVELKRSRVSVSQAYHQIEKYSREGVFSGLFSLVQIFVAMEPKETVYFANPGPDGKFNKDFYFHWADFNNEPINDWSVIASSLLYIPMAHQLIGFYSVADSNDGVLKVMRSYQYWAANKISDKVATTNWNNKSNLGGYIWHTLTLFWEHFIKHCPFEHFEFNMFLLMFGN